MRRRILLTVIAVAVVAVAAFFVPAALAVRSRDAEAQRLDVQREAAIGVATIDPVHPGDAELPSVDHHVYGIYDERGRLIAGDGPATADAPVRAAFAEGDSLEQIDGLVIAALLVDDHDDRGEPVVLRVAEPALEATQATRRAVTRLALGAVAILAAAGVAAWALTARLTRPIEHLRAAAGRLGAGDFTGEVEPTGVAELDEVGDALTAAGRRIGTAMARERAFSADASHQLRTPLTAMRTAIETEQLVPRPDPRTILDELLQQTGRLESIVVSLLELARETHESRAPVDLRSVVEDAARRWTSAAGAADRRVVVERGRAPRTANVSPTAIGHVLDVLLDNAIRHGTGTIHLACDAVGTGSRVTVADEGSIAEDRDLFARRSEDAEGAGIGLHLARSLAEAEGGHLRVASRQPTTFELTFPGAATPTP